MCDERAGLDMDVRHVSESNHLDEPSDPLLRRVLGGLFGDSILTSEGPDWRWQHQTVAPLFRHGEIVRYVPAMVAGAESAIKIWGTARPGSMHAIDVDMLHATYHVICNTLLPGGGALIGETMKLGTADYMTGLAWSTGYAVLNLPVWLPRPWGRRMRLWETRLRAAVADMIRMHHASPDGRDDLFIQVSIPTLNPFLDECPKLDVVWTVPVIR